MSFYLNQKRHNKHKKLLNYKYHFPKIDSISIKAIQSGRLTESEILNLQRLVNKKLKLLSKKLYSIKLWNTIFVNSTLTTLSSESRMGKGKGAISTKVGFIKAGQILFEFSGISNFQAVQLCNYLKTRLPLKIKISKYL